MNTALQPATKMLLQVTILFMALIIVAGRASAGTGKFEPDGNGGGKFNFCVSVRFNATSAQLQIIKNAFETGSQILADATDGHHQFGAPTKHSSSGAGQSVEVLFEYNPSPFSVDFKKSEYVFVRMAADGNTQVLRYGPYNPSIIAVYEDKLPKADVTRLIAASQSAIPTASKLNAPFKTSCDADNFQLAITSRNEIEEPGDSSYPFCLPVMPKEIRELVEEMRSLWKRLPESRLAYAYVRSFVFEKDFLKSPYRNIKQFVSIEKFPPKLRATVRNASKRSPRFYPVSRTQYEQLLSFASDPGRFYVIDGSRGFSLLLRLSRINSQQTPLKE